jgi:hypothetical protein
MHGDWRDSGDFAYLADGEAFITGRAKDLIIRAGRNIYPYELEQAVGDLNGIRKNAVAVFASRGAGPAEELIVLAETRERDHVHREELRAQIDTLALQLTGTRADHVLLAPPRSVLKTSSGKIRRVECRQLYEQGAFTDAGMQRRRYWYERMRLLRHGLGTTLRRGLITASGTTVRRLCLGMLHSLWRAGRAVDPAAAQSTPGAIHRPHCRAHMP